MKPSDKAGIAVALFSLFLLTILLILTPTDTNWQHGLDVKRLDSLERRVDSLEQRLDRRRNQQALWMTRTILSETKRPSEFDEVATVIVNRMGRGYRGSYTIREVVLDPYQFSAYNPNSRVRSWYITMDESNTPWPSLWAKADSVSRQVLKQDPSERPLGPNVTHFYSPRSMGGSSPRWASTMREVPSTNSRDRFRYYAN